MADQEQQVLEIATDIKTNFLQPFYHKIDESSELTTKSHLRFDLVLLVSVTHSNNSKILILSRIALCSVHTCAKVAPQNCYY